MENSPRKEPVRLARQPGRALPAIALSLLSPVAFSQGTGYWHTSGKQILDSIGQVVRIAGVNWYGFETADSLAHGLWAQDYKTVLNTIKANGYNVIRIPFSNQMVESNPVPTNFTSFANGAAANTALVGQTALADLDTLIAYAGSIGLRVILDNHRSEAGNSNEASGLWYTSAYPQANWVADWQTLAARYSASQFTFNGNPTVIGVDLRNEPHSNDSSGSCWTGDTGAGGCQESLTARNWPVAATTAGNAVLAINPHLLVFVEGVDCYSGVCGWQGGNLIGVGSHPVTLSAANQVVYSAHDYGPNLFQQSWFNANTTASSLNAVWNQYWGYISSGGTAPVWVGEFGTTNNTTDLQNTAAGSQGQWFQSLVGYLQANPAIQWTYWALNGEDSYGLLDSNYDQTPASALKQTLLAGIQSPLSGGSSSGGGSSGGSGSGGSSGGSSGGGGGFACHITYTVSSQWPSGFGAAITLTNTGTTAITSWALSWTFANGQTVTQLWNGNATQSGANVSVTNESYNGSIAAGGSYSGMGFNGTWNSTTNAVPTSFAVNGVACQ